MIYHVSVSGHDRASGTAEAPFRTINRAAKVAVAGDTVQVHDGVYREWVDPQNSGSDESGRIIYEAAPGEHPIIKGSEIVTGWERVDQTVWKVTVPNEMFDEWNPYELKIEGDWKVHPKEHDAHLGDVYINGISMFEASSVEDLYEAPVRAGGDRRYFAIKPEKILFPERSIYRWMAEVGESETVIYGNFHELDPNEQLTEINVRRSVFFPKKTGVNYITVRGFEMAHAATPFVPPTADQPGLIGPHWSHHWIIENNDIHDSKCAGISLGKEISTGHNLHSRFYRKSGHVNQTEVVFRALHAGWSKETVGSHIVRNNHIHDCGQNGIVGHLGCAFCVIEHNEIHHIAKKHEFWGHEIGGIKFHAPIDTVIKNNNIHHCSMGVWLDWQAQGTRVSANIFHHNDADSKIEVTHGPCTVDNNIFMSDYMLDNVAQGTAFIHNLICGYIRQDAVYTRTTPYHYPHSTQVLGCSFVYSGDDRIYNNIILGINERPERKVIKIVDKEFLDAPIGYFGSDLDVFTTIDEYKELLVGRLKRREYSPYNNTPQPVWSEGNAYAYHARPFRAEKVFFDANGMTAAIEEENGVFYLALDVPSSIANARCESVTTAMLGMPRIVEQRFENPDGSDIDFSLDVLTERRTDSVIPGPFAHLSEGKNKIAVWKRI